MADPAEQDVLNIGLPEAQQASTYQVVKMLNSAAGQTASNRGLFYE
jgi:hypothetical protein